MSFEFYLNKHGQICNTHRNMVGSGNQDVILLKSIVPEIRDTKTLPIVDGAYYQKGRQLYQASKHLSCTLKKRLYSWPATVSLYWVSLQEILRLTIVD